MDLGLQGKRAIVLAASRGLGRAVAEVLASERATLALCGRDASTVERTAADLRRRFDVQAHAVSCDVSDAAQLDHFFDRATELLGGIDILVNNGGGPPAGTTEAFDDVAWRSAIDLTLLSVVRSCRRVLPLMKENASGRIINITSVAAKQALPNMVLSNTLRAAVAGYSKSLAMEAAPFGILVHCVMPGSFLTDRNRALGADIAAQRGIPLDELIREWEGSVPLGRMGDPVEFGQMVAFFASDKCSFTTGTCIAVEGGQIRSIV
jgi:3-oxoacyl-[acyl-carrier protein] reductase